MRMLYNMIAESEGYKPTKKRIGEKIMPITKQDLEAVFGADWTNFLDVAEWEKEGRTYTTQTAIKEIHTKKELSELTRQELNYNTAHLKPLNNQGDI